MEAVNYLQRNRSNYYVFSSIVDGIPLTIDTGDITQYTYDDYWNGINSILLDGVEQPVIQMAKVRVNFVDGKSVNLTLPDLAVNILLWEPVIRQGFKIKSRHFIFDKRGFTRGMIADHYDKIIDRNLKPHIDKRYRASKYRKNRKLNIVELNRSFADNIFAMQQFVNSFAQFNACTINFYDTIKLAQKAPEFWSLLNSHFGDIPIEDVKDEGMKRLNKSNKYIMESEKYLGYEHCLKNPLSVKQGINPRQYKELIINVGTKPDGKGNVLPAIIDSSYANGLNTITDIYMDAAAARVAQNQTKINVGESGDVARIMGLNNLGTFLHKDPNYVCNTENLEIITIENEDFLERFDGRTYRLNEDGKDLVIDAKTDKNLIGKTLHIYSPITCQSNAQGHGICHRCYGYKLALINTIVCVGKIAVEQLTYQLTQRLLSAKHLLETVITALNWSNGFNKYFKPNFNAIYAIPCKDMNSEIIINMDDIVTTGDVDSYNPELTNQKSYVTGFTAVIDNTPNEITSMEKVEMYLTQEFNEYILENGIEPDEDGNLHIPLKDVSEKGIMLFLFTIDNNELVKVLKELESIVNLKETIMSHDRNSIVQHIIERCIEGDVEIQAVHIETIISNQVRSVFSNIAKPNWTNPNEDSKLITLDRALMDNPSIVISLLYKDLTKCITNPLSFKKSAPSQLDGFAMTHPQSYMLYDDAVINHYKEYMVDPIINLPLPEEPVEGVSEML